MRLTNAIFVIYMAQKKRYQRAPKPQLKRVNSSTLSANDASSVDSSAIVPGVIDGLREDVSTDIGPRRASPTTPSSVLKKRSKVMI
jgi:hypothetical protein